MDIQNEVITVAAGLLLVMASVSNGQQKPGVLLRENFDNLDSWKEVTFPKIEKHTKYAVARTNGSSVLSAEADASASGLQYTKSFKVKEYPRLKWRWKIENVYRKGNARKKNGDDYPIRIYVAFKYDPGRASFGLRAKYGLAKRMLGEYPPHSSLNYIWANRSHKKEFLASPYTDRSIMIPLQSGDARAGKWVTESVNIVDDYRKVFGEDPPEEASLAIMSDADNTGEKSKAYIDFVEVSE